MRIRSIHSVAAGLAAGLALAACGTTTTTEPTSLALDRPIDVAFACFGSVRITGGGRAGEFGDPLLDTAVPIADCDQFAQSYGVTPTPVAPDPRAPPLGQEVVLGPDDQVSAPGVSYYAFILQSVPGTLAISTWVPKPPAQMLAGDVTVVDADALTPGTNGISVGDEPVGIGTDASGCFEVTTNAGSCDMSTLDITSALKEPSSPIVDRVTVKNAAGAPILAQPRTAAAPPVTGTIGVDCPSSPTGVIFVAYPDCHTVAAIDLATSTAVASIQFAADGTATIGDGNFTCPAQCGAGDPIIDGARPTSLSIVDDNRVDDSKPAVTRRLAIGLENSNKVTVIDLDGNHLPTGTPFQLAVQDDAVVGPVGLTDVALTPQIGMGGAAGSVSDDPAQGGAPGGQFQFVYAVATDGSVRVVDTLNLRKECDTQIDPRFLSSATDINYLSCMPVGDPRNPTRPTGLPPPNDTTVAHRPGATNPGIQFVTDSRPISVSIVHAVPAVVSGIPPAPDVWMGYFAIVSATNGSVYVVNVDDDNYPDINNPSAPISTWLALALPHQLRDRISDRSDLAEEQDTSGAEVPVCNVGGDDPDTASDVTELTDGPHMWPTDTTTGHPIAVIAPSTNIAANRIFQLPTIHQIMCIGNDTTMPVSVLGFSAPPAVRAAAFPDLIAMRNDETWTLTWEGSLSDDSSTEHVSGQIVRLGDVVIDGTGMRVTEGTHPYCSLGVEPYDSVVLRGCDPTAAGECGFDNSCYVHPDAPPGSPGSCFPTDEQDALSGPCREFLISQRRYAVSDAQDGQLKLMPRSHVLTTTPLEGCTGADQCSSLEDLQIQLVDSINPNQETAVDPTKKHTWACEADPSRPGPDQCIQSCQAQTIVNGQPAHGDLDCDLGSVCDPNTLRCVEGVVPPLQCVTTLQRYEIDAGRAFTVLGTQSGFIHPIIADSTGECVKDPNADPLQIGRIPLSAPPCLGDGLTDLSPNPCETTVTQADQENDYADPTSCQLAATPTTFVNRTATAIRFRNPMMTFEMVDPVYPGDKNCIGDRAAGLNVPIVFQGYSLEVRIVSGFLPYLLGLSGTVYPINVVHGPLESIWVVDEGDFLSATEASTEGGVYRIESTAPTIINLLQ